MEKENKQPVVYVARKLFFYVNSNRSTIAYYVSKARLDSVKICFSESGKITKEYSVLYSTQEYHKTNDKNIFAENKSFDEVNTVFCDFEDCKKFVKKMNINILSRRLKGKQSIEKKMVLTQYINAKKIGERLEKEFISQEDRQILGENILIF